MAGGGGDPSHYANDELDLTPMIDATFMLLAFFMVSSSMEAASPLQLPSANAGKSKGLKNAAVVTVFYANDHPEIYLTDGRKIGSPATLAEVTDFIRQGVAEQKTTVVIKADKSTPSGFVEEVARAAAEVEGVQDFYVGVRGQAS
jgi:biopolymer transport protein TolR